MRRGILLCAVAGVLILLASQPVLAYPADLDPSFGGDGRVVTDFAPRTDPRDDGAADIVIQPDGKILAVGYARTGPYSEFAVARYNPDGSLDTSFGRGGKVTTDVYPDGNDQGTSVALAEDGKIVVAGYGNTGYQWNQDFAVARYNPDGSLDASFDSDGRATVPDTGTIEYAYNVVVQDDGKIVLAGVSDYDHFALARFNADGSLDASFGTGGKVKTDLSGFGGVRDMQLQPDGKIVAVGSTHVGDYEDVAVARYNTDGSLDTSFDSDGKVVTYLSSRDDEASTVLLMDGGKILVGGQANYANTLLRYNPDGSLDSSFGQDGEVSDPNLSYAPSELTLQADGKILALNRGQVVRYNADGSLDASMGAYASGLEAAGLALQPNGRVLVAGAAYKDGFEDFALARFLGGTDDAPPQTTIVSGPKKATPNDWAEFEVSSSEPNSSFRCGLDGQALSYCDPRYDMSIYSLSQGKHTFRVAATDGAANTDQTPATWTWVVDDRSPKGKVLINRGKATTTNRTVTLSLEATDPSPGSGVAQMRLTNDGGKWTAWQSYTSKKRWKLSGGSGNKVVYAMYKDEANNVSRMVSDTITYRP